MAKHRTGYMFKRGDTYYVQWRVNGKLFSKALHGPDGKPITERRKAEAARAELMAAFTVGDEAAALESITAKLEGRQAELVRLQDAANPPLTIAKAWREYLTAPNRPDTGGSTMEQYAFQFQAFADWMQEKHRELLALRDVTKEIAEEYAGHLITEGKSPNTYNKHLNLLTLVFRVLKDKARLADNPWAEIQRKRLSPQGRRELTLDELKKVCTTATGELRTLLALGVYSGLRLGDCCTLRWGETDLQRGIITRIPNKTARRNPKPVIVPLHNTLQSILAETPKEKRTDYVLPEMAALYQNRIDLVTDRVQAHFKACNIHPHKQGTGKDGKRAVVEVGFHSLRHSFVSLCRASNAPLAVVESIVGHSNPAMTRHYTHVGELAAGQAVAALPAVIGDATEQAPNKADPKKIILAARRIAEELTAGNWETSKAKLLEVLNVN